MDPIVYKSKNSQVETVLPGHVYNLHLPNESGSVDTIELVFQKGAVDVVGERNGWQNEELIAVLIDRIKILNEKMACKENEDAIDFLGAALSSLEQRTKKREDAGVEGTEQSIPESEKPMAETAAPQIGPQPVHEKPAQGSVALEAPKRSRDVEDR